MLKAIGIVVLVLAFFVLMAFMLFASVILSFVNKLRKMMHGDDKDNDYTGRRQQQYSYRGGAGRQTTNSHTTQHRTYTTNSQQRAAGGGTERETIIDTRSPRQADSRIFDDNEGEYVDFVEEN